MRPSSTDDGSYSNQPESVEIRQQVQHGASAQVYQMDPVPIWGQQWQELGQPAAGFIRL